MPYIKKEARTEISDGRRPLTTAGELNYAITVLLLGYTRVHGLSYQTLNEVVGVMECAKQEYYRRLAVPYEEMKILENGDLYL
jgi:cystathionine beta-lyase family protein involved in aluminum resistance